jgi:hypothetical protein
MVAPLKLNATGGDLREMTTTEEQYLAYQAGLQLGDMTASDVSALNPTAGGTNIGAYSNTFYNQAVGTHPGSSLSIGTTTTTLYQNTGTASATGITRPTRFTTSGTRLDEYNDTNYNEIADRLIGIIFVNEYPGCYRLGTSAPSGDWDTHIATVFSDTRADGASVAYNIYQRQAMTAPTAIKPVKLNDASGNVKEMSDAEIKLTFGQIVKTRIMSSANNIGAYQLRSSAAGVPVAGGTWAAKGTATDTRNTTSDVAYVATYSADYSATYTGNYTTNFTGTYTRNRTANRATDFSANYSNPNAVNYTSRGGTAWYYTGTQGFIGVYIGNYLGPGPSYLGNFVGDFIGDFVGNYVGDYTGDFIGDYLGNYVGNYEGNYAGETLGSGTATIETYTLYLRTA